MMKITKVKVYPYKNKSRTGAVGVGLVVLEHQLLLSGLELYERNEKRFVKFPKNEFNKHDLCYCQPTSQAFNSLITNALFKAYDEVAKTAESTDPNDPLNNFDTYLKESVAKMYHGFQNHALRMAANNMDICAQAVGESAEVSDKVTSQDLNPELSKKFYAEQMKKDGLAEVNSVYKES
jgi:DNA-binding cell septation regulator SpoVG